MKPQNCHESKAFYVNIFFLVNKSAIGVLYKAKKKKMNNQMRHEPSDKVSNWMKFNFCLGFELKKKLLSILGEFRGDLVHWES